MEDRPVPKSRFFIPSNEDEQKRPVPAPRRKLDQSCVVPEKTPPAVVPRRRVEQPQFTEWVNDAKRKSKDFALSTRDKIEKGVLIGANLARGILEQGVQPRRSSPQNDSTRLNVEVDDSTQRPLSTSDMRLIGSIQFHSPIKDAPNYENVTINKVTSEESIAIDEKKDCNGLNERACSNVDIMINIDNDNDTNQDTYDVIHPTIRYNLKQAQHQATKSTIFEFDPLATEVSSEVSSKAENELSILESLLNEPYNRPLSIEDDVSNEVNFELYIDNLDGTPSRPPTPPLRYDSLTELAEGQSSRNREVCNVKVAPTDENKRYSLVESFKQFNIKSKKTFTNMVKVGSDTAMNVKKKIDSKMNSGMKLEKPSLPYKTVHHQGLMVRLLSGAIDELFKSFQMRLCILTNCTLTCYSDNTITTVKDVYNIENLFSIQTIFSNKQEGQVELHRFKLTFQNSGGFTSRMSVDFGCAQKSERRNWILKIVECLTDKFSYELIWDMARIGWCCVKEGVSCSWECGWLLLCRRNLYYHTQNSAVRSFDLRKARCVVLVNDDENPEMGPCLAIDFQDKTIYFKMGHSEETKIWRKLIYNLSTSNGTWLYRQQLTKEEVPALVIKCINFVYAYGSLSEYIYRRSGSNSAITALLSDFKTDAWAVQLSPRTHSEYDVATALKRFFRELPEPALSNSISHELCAALELTDIDQKAKTYKDLLSTLNPISQKTLRKLFGHLHFIQTLAESNRMNAENLAAVWGPSLLNHPILSNVESCLKESQVVCDLIELYIQIYAPSKEEMERERCMEVMLQKYQNNTVTISPKPSGDFHIWIYIHSKTQENSVNVVLTPTKSAGELCEELHQRLKAETHNLIIEEVISGDNMRRPLHYSEVLLNVVLRWSYWDEADRKDNYLIIMDGSQTIMQLSSIEAPIGFQYLVGELRYANSKMRTFKNYFFHFGQDTLYCFKDKSANNMIDSWKAKDIIWYNGHESRRNPHTKWTMTIIQRNHKSVRSKDRPWFGCVIGGNDAREMNKLMSVLMRAEFGDKTFPEVKLIAA